MDQATYETYLKRIQEGEKPGPKTLAAMQAFAASQGGGPMGGESDANNDGRVSWGEDVGGAIQSGARKAAAGAIGLPGAIQNTMDDAAQWITGNENLRVPNILNPMSMIGNRDRAFGFPEANAAVDKVSDMANEGVNTILPEALQQQNVRTDYRPETRTGRAAQLAAEIAPGGLAGVGKKTGLAAAKQLAASVGAPAATGWAAGELAKDTGFEDAARGLGTLAGPALAAGVSRLASGGQIDDATRGAVKYLQDRGVNPMAGQATKNNTMSSFEMGSGLGASKMGQAMDDFGHAAIDDALKAVNEIKPLNVPARAPGNGIDRVRAAIRESRNVMDDLANRNEIFVGPKFQRALSDARKAYKARVSVHNQSPELLNWGKKWRLGKRISGDEYQSARTELTDIIKSAQTRGERLAGHAMRSALDDALEASIAQKGNRTDAALYAANRKSYRDLKTIEDAFENASADRNNSISPALLKRSMRKREPRYSAEGTSTFSPLTDAGTSVLTTPQTSRTAQQAVTGILAPMTGAAGAGMGGMVGGVPGAMVGAGVGYGAPIAGMTGLSSNMVQNFLKRGFRPETRLTETLKLLWGDGAALINPNYWAQPGNQQ